MKVIVASSAVPNVRGGASLIVDSLGRALRTRGHEVEILNFPHDSRPDGLLPQYLAMRLHHLSDVADRLISIRVPSHLLQHPEKVLWFIHHHRTAYDLWGTEYGDIPNTPYGRSLRDTIRAADGVAFRESRSIFTNSRSVKERLLRFNGVQSEVLYPPLDDPERFHCDSYGDFVVYISRLADHKRQALVIDAMNYTKTPVKLVIAGEPASNGEADRLRSHIKMRGLQHTVDLRVGWLSEEDKVELLSQCLAAVYCPFDEDSYGYPSLEAHQSSKAVISTTDAGGVAELVTDSQNGYLCDPTPTALASRFDELFEDKVKAQKMGETGLRRLSELGIGWDSVIEGLLA